jgi:spore cortex formation protein SpoVR/YcgB (stage V sporulation)
VLGHADFAKNNHLFARFMEMSGTNIVEHAAAQAHRIEEAVKEHGQQRVEAMLDAALALEPHVDVNQELHRSLSPKYTEPREAPARDGPFAAEQQAALAINPYHLGFSMWERIVEKKGIDFARDIRRDEDDFGFVRNYLDEELCDKLGLFVFEAKSDDGIKINSRDVNQVREAILAPKFNYGAPRIHVAEMKNDGTLILAHDHASDGRGLDLERASRVLQYVHRAWRRPVMLQTIDSRGSAHELRAGTS